MDGHPQDRKVLPTESRLSADSPSQPRPPLDSRQAAAFLNVEVRWMRRAVLERRLPYYKPGRHLRFRVEDLEELMDSSKVERSA